MQINAEMIKRLERLSKIELSKTEREKLASQLNRIISYVRMLGEADGEEPSLFHGISPWNELREDEKGKGLGRQKILSNAPDFANGFLRVPGIIEPEE